MRVLVTGAAGALGRVLVPGLAARGHQVAGLDLTPSPPGETVEWHQADCTDAAAVSAAVSASRPDAVVHLAGNPGESSLPEALRSHVHTTAALLDAMVEHQVGRMVYASSNHAVGRTPRAELPDGVLRADARPRPDTFYGVAKVAAEALLSLYADRHGIAAVACRIGSFLPEPATTRALSTWLSPGDAVAAVQAALTGPTAGFAVLYGVSANGRGWWDLEPGRALGFVPADDAEQYADRVPARVEDEAEATFVGGPFALEQFHRPALDR